MADADSIRQGANPPKGAQRVEPAPQGYKIGQVIRSQVGSAMRDVARNAAPGIAWAKAAYDATPSMTPTVAPFVEGMLGLKPGVLPLTDKPTMAKAAAQSSAAPEGARVVYDPTNGPRVLHNPAAKTADVNPLTGLPLNVLERVAAMRPKPPSARDQAIGQASSLSQSIFQNAMTSIENQHRAGRISSEEAQQGVGSAIKEMYERQARLVGFQQLPQFQVAQPED